ncbi:MAG: 30S ribosomal protein S17 [Methanopyri archaeon]|nr:30S ribosomal protein S17 [Methanopyri archaeon]
MAECNDPRCPQHGTLSTRGSTHVGTVVSDKMHGTVIVHWGFNRYYPKFERFTKRSTRVAAHNPPCIGAKKGDVVRIAECRPLSKSKYFVVIEKLG